MADMRWTPGQEDAIQARNGTVLVAAAAGSGKTAVLVQRAIERLTDPEHPAPADRLLIVTFTKAAAAEMRARLEKAALRAAAPVPPGPPFAAAEHFAVPGPHRHGGQLLCRDGPGVLPPAGHRPGFQNRLRQAGGGAHGRRPAGGGVRRLRVRGHRPPGRRLLRGAGRPPADEHGAHPVPLHPVPPLPRAVAGGKGRPVPVRRRRPLGAGDPGIRQGDRGVRRPAPHRGVGGGCRRPEAGGGLRPRHAPGPGGLPGPGRSGPPPGTGTAQERPSRASPCAGGGAALPRRRRRTPCSSGWRAAARR